VLVFARRPAPVQATYLGYPGTTGLAAMDWRLTDRFFDPREGPPFGTDKLMYLKTTYWCCPPPVDAPPVATAPPYESTDHITFGCLNGFVKVSDASISALATLLSRIPNARLLLPASPGPHLELARPFFA